MAAALFLVVAACGTHAPARSQDAASSVPGTVPASVSPGIAPACANGPVSNPATGGGDDLKVEILHQQGGGAGWNLALPASSAKNFPELAGTAQGTDAFGSFSRAFDDGGAFSYDGAVLELSLYNLRSSGLTIHDIRVVNKRVVCPPDGLLFLEGNEGGDFVNIAFHLDAAAPIAHEKTVSGEIKTEPYFGAHVIPVKAKDQITVEMDMSGVTFAYEFDLAVDYTVGGAKHTQLVRRRNGPFRVTTPLCPRPDARSRLSDSDVSRLKAQRYGLIRQRLGEVDAAGAYIYKNFTTAEFLKSCPTW
ncbi:hypothetical protein Rhe02_78360 [Rhizocola hellebori]|uniref:Uncharacterized protein n=1 Tax=Rhizocola hellebori TaxID=1392758 RepID=A0A8J3QHK5_9ACTN|nr:hypothetical protein Rhe02_78360 [Rhizocola hellebori]